MTEADPMKPGVKTSEVIFGLGGFGLIAMGILTGQFEFNPAFVPDILRYSFILSGLLMVCRTALKIVDRIMVAYQKEKSDA